jgi:hypothetical protein
MKLPFPAAARAEICHQRCVSNVAVSVSFQLEPLTRGRFPKRDSRAQNHSPHFTTEEMAEYQAMMFAVSVPHASRQSGCFGLPKICSARTRQLRGTVIRLWHVPPPSVVRPSPGAWKSSKPTASSARYTTFVSNPRANAGCQRGRFPWGDLGMRNPRAQSVSDAASQDTRRTVHASRSPSKSWVLPRHRKIAAANPQGSPCSRLGNLPSGRRAIEFCLAAFAHEGFGRRSLAYRCVGTAGVRIRGMRYLCTKARISAGFIISATRSSRQDFGAPSVHSRGLSARRGVRQMPRRGVGGAANDPRCWESWPWLDATGRSNIERSWIDEVILTHD